MLIPTLLPSWQAVPGSGSSHGPQLRFAESRFFSHGIGNLLSIRVARDPRSRYHKVCELRPSAQNMCAAVSNADGPMATRTAG